MATFDMNTSIFEMAWALSITGLGVGFLWVPMTIVTFSNLDPKRSVEGAMMWNFMRSIGSSFYISLSFIVIFHTCLLYTSPSPRDKRQSRMPSSA